MLTNTLSLYWLFCTRIKSMFLKVYFQFYYSYERWFLYMPTAFTSAASAVWTSVGDAITVITGNAVLLLPVAIGFTGAVVGIVRRMTKIGSGRRR